MRLAFLGTPQLAVPTLRALAAHHEVALVVSQADKKRGRGGALLPSPMKAAAVELGIPVTHRVKDVVEAGIDTAVVVAFGRLLKPAVLEKVLFLNIHPSLLPRWRGPTPIESAILAGDERSGVCVMKLEEEMDAGPVYARAEVEIEPQETAAELSERLFAMGTDMLVELLGAALPEPEPQVGEPTFCRKIFAEDLHIDWSKSAVEINRLSRIGRTWTTFRGKRFLVLQTERIQSAEGEPGTLTGTVVATGNGGLRLLRVQPEGKGPQDASAWANGARLQPGDKLGG